MNKVRLVALIVLVSLAGGCAALQSGKVDFCENKRCVAVQTDAQKQELLGKLYALLKNNLNRDIVFYETDPAKREQTNIGFGYFLQGGPIPGWAKIRSVKFTDILYIDREKLEIKFKVDPDMTWNMTPVFSMASEGTLSVKDNNQIKYSTTYLVSWMVVGTSAWKHEMMFDFIDLDKNLMGSHYSIGGGGPVCAGGGSGYTLARFPVGIQEQQDSIIIAVRPQGPALQAGGGKPPVLDYRVSIADGAGRPVLEGGKEALLTVELSNIGGDTAKDVQIVLSGSQELVGYWGEKHAAGDVKPGERKAVAIKAVLPAKIQTAKAQISIEIREGRGFSPAEKKSVTAAVLPAGVTETVEVISQLPQLSFSSRLKDQNNNRILDGGEEITLSVEVANQGQGAAKDVQVVLSGHQELVSWLGARKFVGDVKPGEKKTAEFKTVLPARISSETANLRIEVIEGQGFAPAQRKTLQIAMRTADVKETVEIISEVNVDDIPPHIKDYERRDAVALVIGISKYREEKIPAVKYAVRDAEVMAKYLENLGGIPRANIKVLIDDKASKSDIQAYIEDWLPRRVNSNSTVFVYYSGHGAPDLQGKNAFIVPYEGQPDFPSKLYPLQAMYDSLSKLPVKEAVVMLDSCFSGAKGRSISPEGARPLVMTPDAIVPANDKVFVLAGASGSQISSDFDRAQHGLFTYYILRGMRGEADRKRTGSVELGDLFRYVKANVAEKASLELNRDQTPVILPPEDKAAGRLNVQITRTR
jgi:hypothetical protein